MLYRFDIFSFPQDSLSSYCNHVGKLLKNVLDEELAESHQRLRQLTIDSINSTSSKYNESEYKNVESERKSIESESKSIESESKTIQQKSNSPDSSSSTVLKPDTLIFPSLQMKCFDITADQLVTKKLLSMRGGHIHLATGYFNLTKEYSAAILKSAAILDDKSKTELPAKFDILSAHPTANGFLGAAGFAGAIPSAYTYLYKVNNCLEACPNSPLKLSPCFEHFPIVRLE